MRSHDVGFLGVQSDRSRTSIRQYPRTIVPVQILDEDRLRKRGGVTAAAVPPLPLAVADRYSDLPRTQWPARGRVVAKARLPAERPGDIRVKFFDLPPVARFFVQHLERFVDLERALPRAQRRAGAREVLVIDRFRHAFRVVVELRIAEQFDAGDFERPRLRIGDLINFIDLASGDALPGTGDAIQRLRLSARTVIDDELQMRFIRAVAVIGARIMPTGRPPSHPRSRGR